MTFKDGSSTIAGCSALYIGQKCTTSALSTGSHSITAVYSGDANNLASTSPALVQTVVAASATTTALKSSASSVLYGDDVTLTATVSGQHYPSGTVSFFVDSAPITSCGTTGCCANVPISNGVAKCTFGAFFTPGKSYKLTASYNGDSYNLKSNSGTVTLSVQGNYATAQTITTLSSSLNPSKYKNAVTFTAKVKLQDTGAAASGGTVAFYTNISKGYVIPGCAAVPLNGGSATCTTDALNTGTHLYIQAAYSGSSSALGGNSVTFKQTVQTSNQKSTATTLSSSQNPAMPGAPITFTAKVISDGQPAASLVFTDGGATIAGCTSYWPTDISMGYQATCTTSALAPGNHSIVATQGSDGTHTSSSATLTEKISTGIGSTTSVTSSASSVTYGTPVTFTATVVGGNGIKATGTVAFKDGSSTISGCSAAALNSSSKATCTTSALSTGSHTITAVYAGDANLDASTSAGYTQNIKTTIDVVMTSPVDGAEYGGNGSVVVSLAAEATTTTTAPISKVEFYANNKLVGTDSSTPYRVSASFSVGGSYSIYAKAYDTAGQSAKSESVAITTCNTKTCDIDDEYE